MWLGFFKECMVSLIFLGINLLSLSITFFWSQLKLWSASQQRLAISFLSQSQFLAHLLCSCKRDFKVFSVEKVDRIFWDLSRCQVSPWYLQHTVNLCSFWSLPLGYLWLAFSCCDLGNLWMFKDFTNNAFLTSILL